MAATRAEKPQNSAESGRPAVLLGRGSLLPEVRRADAATLVPADGTSRRHQIKDTGSLHVARVPAMTFNRAGINSIPCLATKETIHG